MSVVVAGAAASVSPISEGMLLAELRHRTSNVFQLVGGVLSGAAALERGSARLALQRAGAQLAAFALLDDELASGCEGSDGPCLSAYLERICRHLSDACLEPRGVAMEFRGTDALPIDPRRCRHLGLAVIELVFNAAKHAFRRRGGHRVLVELRRDGARAILTVSDDGRGFAAVAGDGRQGMGFVGRLAAAAGAELRRVDVPRGSRFKLAFDPGGGRRGVAPALTFLELLPVLLLLAVCLLQAARRLGLPYPPMLAGAGCLVALVPGAPAIALDPSTALALFVAPALVEAAYDFPLRDARRLWAPVVAFAVFAVIATTASVAVVGFTCG